MHVLETKTEYLNLREMRKVVPQYKEYGLKPNELRFIGYYLFNGYNATRAYLSVYNNKNYKKGTASVKGCELLNSSKVMRALKDLFDDWLGEKKLKLEKEIIDVYYRRAFYPLHIFYNEYHEVKPFDEIPEKYHCCIDGIERKYFGKDADRTTVVLKLSNREKALEQLAKYISLFNDADMTVNINSETMNKLHDIFNQNKPMKKVN